MYVCMYVYNNLLRCFNASFLGRLTFDIEAADETPQQWLIGKAFVQRESWNTTRNFMAKCQITNDWKMREWVRVNVQ